MVTVVTMQWDGERSGPKTSDLYFCSTQFVSRHTCLYFSPCNARTNIILFNCP